MAAKTLVIVATYNEIANLPELVKRIRFAVPTAEILVVDDDSPDGTGAWAIEQSSMTDDLHVIVRTNEKGLGSATITGFRWGLERGYARILTMDADFSHSPESIPELLGALPENGEPHVVIGSRYVADGRIVGWPMSRRLVSRCVNLLARFWLGLKTRDNTGAFRAYNAKAFQQIDLSDIRAEGYGYLEEILYRFQQQGVRFSEVPIVFTDRQTGESKTSLWEGISVLKQIVELRFRV